MNVGIIGCGNISDVYFANCKKFGIPVLACADLDPQRAREKAKAHHIPRVTTTNQLLAQHDVQLIINLTRPPQHAPISMLAIRAGKHVYSEKPLAIRYRDGKVLLDAAHKNGVRIGCAPDTFMGAGLQTCRELIDQGSIGRPLAATAFMIGHGPESWHPDPKFFFQPGGGPLFDMGPYYLTALVQCLGPALHVQATATSGFPTRAISRGPQAGKKFRTQNSRGLGVLDMIQTPHPRASGELALHILDIMERILDSTRTGRRIKLRTTCQRSDSSWCSHARPHA